MVLLSLLRNYRLIESARPLLLTDAPVQQPVEGAHLTPSERTSTALILQAPPSDPNVILVITSSHII